MKIKVDKKEQREEENENENGIGEWRSWQRGTKGGWREI